MLPCIKKLAIPVFASLLLLPTTLHASFIESTMGAAVVNDATAVYYNPAALVLLKNPQIIALGSGSELHTQFTGQATQNLTELILKGTSNTDTQYYLPSLYFGTPITKRLALGFAVIGNSINKDIEGHSILRYAQSNSSIKALDVVPAIEFKFSDVFSVGAAMNISHASFLLKPTTGFPSLNIPDSESHNECDGTGIGSDVGFLFRPHKSTTIGFNYRSAITYRLSGKSIFEGTPRVISNHYGFTFWTPARSVLSINQFLTTNWGLIGTAQRIQWSIFDKINIHGIATQIGLQPVILNASVPYHFRDTWLVTLGTHYRITPKWIVRFASSYNQSPGNGRFQISHGDSIILGATMGYDLTKNITIDTGYAHAFIQDQDINITGPRNNINGTTKGSINAVQLKLTFNIT